MDANSSYTLSDVEDGFARVRDSAGKVVGHVSREKWGSGNYTRWTATSRIGGQIGHATTRTEAVRLLADWHERLAARRRVSA